MSGNTGRLAVVLIVRDECDVLASTLDSARSIADELIVIDTGSTDGTQDLARSAGATVIEQPWSNDFSTARNRGFEAARADWILWLDAGEQLHQDDAEELARFMQHHADATKAYYLWVEVPVDQPAGSSQRAARLRLTPNLPGLRFSGRIRESLLPAMADLNMDVELQPCRLLRSLRDHDPQVKQRRVQRDLELIRLALSEEGNQPRLLNALGELQLSLGNRDRAAECFVHSMKLSAPDSTDLLQSLYGLLSAYDEDQTQERIATCMEALELFPIDTGLLCTLGHFLQADVRLELAARSFETAARFGQLNPELWHLSNLGELAGFWHAVTLQSLGKDQQAFAVLESLVNQSGTSLRVRRHLLDLLIKRGDEKAAQLQIDALFAGQTREESPQRAPLRTAVHGACAANQHNWAAALPSLKTAYKAGCRDPLCLRYLALALLAIGDEPAAAVILGEWLTAEPGNLEAQRYLLDCKSTPESIEQALSNTLGTSGVGKIPTPPQSTTKKPHAMRGPHSKSGATDPQRAEP